MPRKPAVASFGDVLREFRVRCGLSQSDLAEKAGISEAAVGALERGVRKAPYPDTVSRLAKALKLGATDSVVLFNARVSAGKSVTHEEGSQNFPVDRTSFVGRASDVSQIVTLLRRSRLVTITGSGGVGKTRAAIKAAKDLQRGYDGHEAWFVDLAPSNDGDLVASRIALSIVPPLTNVETADALAAKLAKRQMLLLLDNCEHVIEAVAPIADLILERCPGVAVLATSRERLNVAGEFVYRLPSLQKEAAVDLFVQRAEAAGPQLEFGPKNLPIVGDIVRRLDGIPLAIELAAAQVPILGLGTLQARLDEEFRLPSGRRDLPARQQTVLATIEWSYNLLAPRERELLCDVSIFAGSFGLAAAEAVCALDPQNPLDVLPTLTSLIDKSLISVLAFEGQARYSLLESVRTFGLERLREAKRTDHLARRLAAWLARCGDVLDSTLQEDVSPYLHEWDNIGTALAWSLNAASQDDRVLGARILVGLADLWDNASRHDEHLRWVALALEGLDESRHPIIVAKLLRWLLMRTQFQAGALDLAPRAIRLAERAGDLPELARLHSHLMRIYAVHDRLEEAERSAAIAAKLHREVGLEASPISVLFLLDRVDLRVRQGRFDDARADANEAEAKALAIAGCAGNVPKCNYRRAQIEYAAGNATEALIHIEALQGSEFLSQTDSRFVMLRWLTVLHLLLGHLNEALPPLCEMLLIVRDSESIDHTELEFAALACALGGNAIASARILGFVRAWEERAQPVRARARKDAYELLCNSLRQQLDEHELERAARAGAFLTHAHVVDEALAALELQHST